MSGRSFLRTASHWGRRLVLVVRKKRPPPAPDREERKSATAGVQCARTQAQASGRRRNRQGKINLRLSPIVATGPFEPQHLENRVAHLERVGGDIAIDAFAGLPADS